MPFQALELLKRPSSLRADSPRVYIATMVLHYHRRYHMIAESEAPALVRLTLSGWLENPVAEPLAESYTSATPAPSHACILTGPEHVPRSGI